MELKPRIRDGKESDTHFLYKASNGREWSVVNFKKMMEKGGIREGDNYDKMFHYRWEGMTFEEPRIEEDQYRGATAEEVIEQIESNASTSPEASAQ